MIEVSGGSLGLIVDTVERILPVPADKIGPLPTAADTGFGDEIAAVGERLIVLIDAERALGSLLPRSPARQRKPSAGRPRASARSPRKAPDA